jgi:enamine deaminase RidA (YjgF/YER057c/UK114 family)
MEELLVKDAGMNVSMPAVMPGEGREPKAAQPVGVPVPQHSGSIASLVCGDYVFVAGQMPNNEAMTGLDPKAYRAPNAVWNGTDIRLQSEFLITSRLKSGLEAGGSSLANAIKAQVYLTDINDFPEFMDVWNSHFAESPCALTVVGTKGLALQESKIEINIFGVRDKGAIKKEVIDHRGSDRCVLGRRQCAGDLLRLSALSAADEEGPIPSVRIRWPNHFRVPMHHQMSAILDAAGEICEASGTSLENVTRAHHFLSDLGHSYPACWCGRTGFMALQLLRRRSYRAANSGLRYVVDLWAYCPGR